MDAQSVAVGAAPQVFRFPGGSVNAYNGATYRDIISEMVRRGFVYFDWNRMSGGAAPVASRMRLYMALKSSR